MDQVSPRTLTARRPRENGAVTSGHVMLNPLRAYARLQAIRWPRIREHVKKCANHQPCCYVSWIITLPPMRASLSLGPGCRARLGRAGVRVTPAFETPSGLWAVYRPHATRAHQWRHCAQPLRRPVQVAVPCAAQLRHARLFPIDHYRYARIMSRKILSVICASLSPISSVCSIIIHGVMVCYRLRGRVPVGCGKFHIPPD
jgi:hypothetical protein